MTSVLHLVSDRRRRGAQVFAVQLCDALADRGIDGTVLALADQPGDDSRLAVELAPSGWRERRALCRAADLVVAHGSTTLWAAALAAPGRFVYRSIGDPSFWLDRPRRRLATGAALTTARAVVALWPGAADALHTRARVRRGKLHVIPNAAVPVPTTGRPDLPDGPFALYVGSCTWEKQVHHIIDAIGEVDDLGLVCLGDGPLADDLRRHGAAVLGDRFTMPGTVADPGPYQRAARLAVLASRSEGMPGVVIEAALAGTPSVAPDVGGVRDLIDHGVSGVVVPDPTPAALAAAIAHVRDHADEMGDAARRHVEERFTLDVVADRWAELIRSLTS